MGASALVRLLHHGNDGMFQVYDYKLVFHAGIEHKPFFRDISKMSLRDAENKFSCSYVSFAKAETQIWFHYPKRLSLTLSLKRSPSLKASGTRID